jgi:hypothetical protein
MITCFKNMCKYFFKASLKCYQTKIKVQMWWMYSEKGILWQNIPFHFYFRILEKFYTQKNCWSTCSNKTIRWTIRMYILHYKPFGKTTLWVFNQFSSNIFLLCNRWPIFLLFFFNFIILWNRCSFMIKKTLLLFSWAIRPSW